MRYRADEAYAERAKVDKSLALLTAAANGGNSQDLEAQLASFAPTVPQMPPTAAVLATIPASASHPGAIYRLAGDR